MKGQYGIKVIRSVLGRFMWELYDLRNNKKIAEAPRMLSRRENCMEVVNPLAVALKARVDVIDLSKDYEE